MARISLNKTELKRQHETLESYEKCLPLLELKRKQLQSTERSLRKVLTNKNEELNKSLVKVTKIAALSIQTGAMTFLGNPEIISETVNTCGVKTKKITRITIPVKPYKIADTPFCLESLLEYLKECIKVKLEYSFLNNELHMILKELTKVTQRVNLYSKVLIPKTQKNIKEIKIYLDDQQTAAVVRGKKCKSLIERRKK